MAVKDEDFAEFGFDSSQLLGDSILTLIGPRSDQAMFQAAIQNREPCIKQLTLYDRKARSHTVMISFSPLPMREMDIETLQQRVEMKLTGCLLLVKPSQAVSLREVFENNFCAQALVSASEPYSISLVNEPFNTKFGCCHSQAHGQPLSLIQGSSSENWASMLSSVAQEGCVVRGRMSTCNNRMQPDHPTEGDVICAPVVEAPNGAIRYILVLFAPHRSETSEADHDLFVAADSLRAGPTARASAPVVLPRRKQRQGEQKPAAAPVVVTAELLNGVRGLPLRKAAATVGLSPTAFKKACRKLGLDRWDYQRPAGKRGPYMRCRAQVASFGSLSSAGPARLSESPAYGVPYAGGLLSDRAAEPPKAQPSPTACVPAVPPSSATRASSNFGASVPWVGNGDLRADLCGAWTGPPAIRFWPTCSGPLWPTAAGDATAVAVLEKQLMLEMLTSRLLATALPLL